MMGVFDDEVEEVSQSTMKSDLRIAGFIEEENRLKHRSVNRSRAPVKIPQGTYIFCDFRTLHIPGVELNPPPSEALRRMHILASDPGIIAIMNKHRWRVGVMTEMAPVGYVGISPKCLLGFNKNQGEEISLRLRTDDLKGFRKYETIKKTLLHELAHMVHSEHDANFFALDKQLNEEAVSLDWTKSRSQTLSGHRFSDHYEEDIDVEKINYSGQKVGGTWNPMVTARASSAAAAAAYRRRLEASASSGESQAAENAHLSFNKGNPSDASTVLDPDDGGLEGVQEKIYAEPGSHSALVRDKENKLVDVTTGRREPYPESLTHSHNEPDPDDCLGDERIFEPDPDDCSFGEIIVSSDEPDPDDSQFIEAIRSCEPDSDIYISDKVKPNNHTSEPDPDDSVSSGRMIDEIQAAHTSLGGVSDSGDHGKEVLETGSRTEQDSESSLKVNSIHMEPDPDDHMEGSIELQRIEEPVDALWARLQKAIKKLRSEITPAESTIVLQTLFKIIRNVIDHPNEVKFQRLRKANPHFQRNVVNYKAAMEVLTVVGFCEDIVSDETGRVEAYVVLKRNDPGLLWLAKSSLEVSMA